MLETCLICGDILIDDCNDLDISEMNMKKTILKCGHSFHYSCIYLSYKYSNNHQCPYCRKDGGFLDKNDKYCKAIIKSGKNKGNICNCRIKIKDALYCGRHNSNK